jgi:hypothetical protein
MLEGYNCAGKEVEGKGATIIRRVNRLQELGGIRKEWQVLNIGITDNNLNENKNELKPYSLGGVVGDHSRRFSITLVD